MKEKQTKIIATISGLNCGVEFLKEMYDEGMNVVRINTAHQDLEGMHEIIANIRKVSEKIPILLDTKGPEIRTTKGDQEIHLTNGDSIKVKGDSRGISTDKELYFSYDNIVSDVPVGKSILIDDGDIELVVDKKDHDTLYCTVRVGGIISGRKSVNIPSVNINLPSLTQKDREFIDFAMENDITFIAHSFVRNKEDLQDIQKILDEKKSKIKIIAKIENQQGIDNLHEILHHSYGIMVARGDLGIEIAAEKIPVIQRKMIEMCQQHRKPVIIATQMLHSMIKNPRPTRAEVNDVASAVFSDADCIMLSGETAYGKYPVESVSIMSRIAREVESQKSGFSTVYIDSISNYDIPTYLAKSAVTSTLDMPVKAIVFDTERGQTAANVAAFRPKVPTYAMCYSKRVMRELALHYGVYANYMDKVHETESFLKKSLDVLAGECVQVKDIITVLAGNFGVGHGASFVEVSTVENLLKLD